MKKNKTKRDIDIKALRAVMLSDDECNELKATLVDAELRLRNDNHEPNDMEHRAKWATDEALRYLLPLIITKYTIYLATTTVEVGPRPADGYEPPWYPDIDRSDHPNEPPEIFTGKWRCAGKRGSFAPAWAEPAAGVETARMIAHRVTVFDTLLAQLTATQAENTRLIAELVNEREPTFCSACAGTGEPLSGLSCVCDGSGLEQDEIIGLRNLVLRREYELAEARVEIERLRNMVSR